ncbi:hypothetical protein CEY11_18580 [Candidimonas nitroreducens]|uniref:Solute-binding protein family 5 domain-containing protein n=1 Tax=Candidimonas nitroreducens TaxID=683354 RepID=A0A225M9F0_9BURK|nr:hypothetical protein CEY11_18580 [Candidimonas nitroreducens]
MFRGHKAALALAAAAFLSHFTSAAAKEPACPKGTTSAACTLTVATDAEPSTFDWMASTQGSTQIAGVQVFETLYTVDSSYSPVPMLAAGMPQIGDAGRTYTIPLRSGVKFQDGTPMTASDVVASLQRWGQVSPIGEAMWANVAQISAPTPLSVKIELKQPYDVVRTLAVPIAPAIIMPKAIVDKYGKSSINDVKDLIGTGPYRLTAWHRGQNYVLNRYDGYSSVDAKPSGLAGRKAASFSKVVVSFVPDSNTRLQSAIGGQYKAILNLPADLYAQVKTAASLKPQIIRPYYAQFLLLNTSKPPFDNVKVRRAAALAINQSALGQLAYGDPELYQLSPGIYPKGMGVLTSGVGADSYDHPDLKKAKQLLSEAGYHGEPVVLMTSTAISWIYNASIVLQSQLTAAGFNVKMKVMDWATMNAHYKQTKTWDMFSTGFGLGYILPTSNLLLTGHFPFDGWYGKGKVAKLLADWNTAGNDSKKQSEVMNEIQAQFYRDVPAVKIADIASLNAFVPSVDVSAMSFYQPTWWNAKVR